MKKDKILGIVLGILFYVLSSIFFFYLYVIEVLAGSVSDFSSILFYIAYLIIPIIILMLPIIFKLIFKKKFYKSVCYSALIIILYILLLFLLQFGIRNYFNTFTKEKWINENWHGFRYLMIEDLEKQYNLIGMNKEEIYQILGEEDRKLNEFNDNKSLCYSMRNGFFEGDYYIIILNDEDIVIDIDIKHSD